MKFLDTASLVVFVLSLSGVAISLIWGDYNAAKVCGSVTAVMLGVGILFARTKW